MRSVAAYAAASAWANLRIWGPVKRSNAREPVRFASVDQIIAAAHSAEQLPDAVEQITQLLRERHGLRPEQPDDFTVRNMAELADTLDATGRLMRKLLLAVATISLIVGGVGIMNIMLVSVTERTREIGLRMAVGGRRSDILMQFLVEAVALCLLGGLIGVAIGVGTAAAVAFSAQWPILIAPNAILMALGAAALTGVVFGFFPARRAAHLNPIEALRTE